ncbi:putative RNA methyltransferase-domain-containing protein [Zychaea mexicana]|uniref:putative RNA methyltransferase-domain-containing protein n=1 Tax=Zychaea mexicana TaxID=64656 RepID=UPI0022FF1416|nr:putative RNA methyltransferase-domain-containing protein [Zychaea mexicana]KAI9499244.1 putative RNA methyltransferase-domain-containing protein [Zychaea mexicana]
MSTSGNRQQQKRKKPPKTYENKHFSGPLYDPNSSRPGKVQKTTNDNASNDKQRFERPRKYTITVAIPASVVDSAPTLEMKTILAGQIARSLVIFNVDEVVIYDDKKKWADSKINPNLFLARVLQYMETPQYLRKALVPFHPDLKFAGLLPPLETPHHPNLQQAMRYREGVTLNKEGTGTLVDIGMYRRARLEKLIQPGVRVTVELPEPLAAADTRKGQKPINVKAVSPKAPREKAGHYWGYHIRLASSFSRVITESPYEGGYDFTVGISDRDARDMFDDGVTNEVKSFKHLLFAFGGPSGDLQEAVEADEDLKCAGEDTAELFDLFVDPSARAGTRSVRLEARIDYHCDVRVPGCDFKRVVIKCARETRKKQRT